MYNRQMSFSPHTTLYVLIGIGVIFLALLAWNVQMEMRLSRLLKGKNAKSLEDTIQALAAEITGLQKFEGDMKKYCSVLETRVRRSLQGVEMVRFDPFKGTGGGGKQSFAISLVDENGDGFLISSLHHREGMSIFTKPLAKFVSSQSLTEEEAQSVEGARKRVRG